MTREDQGSGGGERVGEKVNECMDECMDGGKRERERVCL